MSAIGFFDPHRFTRLDDVKVLFGVIAEFGKGCLFHLVTSLYMIMYLYMYNDSAGKSSRETNLRKL